ncbi:MAG TPA: hypothetical protein VL244_02115 [Alphaproteobacteria bacterium]|nr:hypothetical protein [Alphaproteobacteria bacterium]
MSATHLRAATWPPRIGLGSPSGEPWWSRLAACFRTEAAKPAAEPEHSRAGDVRIPRRILIAQGHDGRWRAGGEGYAKGPDFALLSEALVFARDGCAAAPATIELRIGEVVAVVHQGAGWPKPICGEALKHRARRRD